MSATIIIVAITALISFIGFSSQQIINALIFNPYTIKRNFQWYRFVSHGILHGDIPHLAFNMIALYSFGQMVEMHAFGSYCVFDSKATIFFIVLYVTALVVSSIPSYLKHQNNTNYNALGASGAVSAVIFAGITLLPQLPIRFMFIPIDIPGIVFGVVYLAVSAYLDKKGNSNIGHSAHFWGAVYGVLFTFISISLFGKMNVLNNFIQQLQAMPSIVPFDCNL